MNLLELCEPTFLYICTVNRIYRNGGELAVSKVEADIADMRGEIQSKLIQEDSILNQQFESIELAYIYFIDSMLVASGMTEWNDNRIAVNEFNRRAGDNEFFDLLYDAEAEVGEDADSKLAFYYCCIGLGFTGMYEDDPKHLHEIMQRLEPRVRIFMDRDVISRITPEAYSHNLEMNVAPETAPRYLGLLFLAIGTVFAITISIFYLYIDAFSNLSKVLKKIITS